VFGNLAAIVNANKFAGPFGSALGVGPFDASSRAELAATPGAGHFGPAERPMGGYLAPPAAWARAPKKAPPWVEWALVEAGARYRCTIFGSTPANGVAE
jgi:hypothetical protein